jgi:hypothetical protein
MSEPAHAVRPEGHGTPGAVSLPWLVLTGVLIGVGLIGTAYWLVTFSWLMFLSLIPLSVGAVLLFTRATGVDHA